MLPDRQLIEHRRLQSYDSYWYAHHDHPPLPVLDDGGRRWRWWFNALHRLDFSWLVQNRVLWHTTVWTLCLAGLITSASGTVIGWRRLRRKRHQQAQLR